MTTATLVKSAPQSQTQTSPVWDKPSAITPEFQPNIINPSRNIIADDEVYLRDKLIAAAIISWDEGTYNTPDQVTAADITNIAIAGDTVWYQIDYHRAIPLNIETFHSHRIQIQQHQVELDLAEAPQLVGFAGDSTGYQLRPSPEALTEYESGHSHGMLDASYGSQPMCEEAECHYSAGYLDGYNSFQQPQPVVSKRTQWSVSYNPKWNWYSVWVGDRACGRASTIEEAERMAQRYITDEEFWQRHRQAVLAAYAA